ncbi:MAG: hypothetical protein ABIL68_13215 [bacterium]
MCKCIGVWIDHKKACVVSLVDGRKFHFEIESRINIDFDNFGCHRSSSPSGHRDKYSDSKIQNRYKKQLDLYYQSIIKSMQDAQNILIFGPGEAKYELKKKILKWKHLSSKIVGLESADRMTERQIEKKVQNFYSDAMRIFNTL